MLGKFIRRPKLSAAAEICASAILLGIVVAPINYYSQSPLQAPASRKNGSATIRLLDASTGTAIANALVEVRSNNGIRCATVPCPTNAQQWHGTSDKNGILTIPHEVVQFETLVAISSYQGSANLGKELERAMGRIVLVKLFPKYESNELEKLLGHLKHPDRGVRLRAFQEIRTRGVKEEAVIQALTASLQDRDAIIRAAAAHAFRFTWASVKPPVTQLQELLNDPEATVRVSAVDALLTALDQNERAQVEPAMIPALLKCLGNRDRDVVYKAGTLLSAIGEPAVSGLMAALRDQREHVRSHAAFALQQIGPKARAAIEPLRELLSDPSAEVRERASLSIQAIAGK